MSDKNWFEGSVAQARELVRVIKNMKTTIDEGTLYFEDGRVTLREMDPAHVCLVDLEIPATAFSNYTLKAPGYLHVDIEYLDALLQGHSYAENKLGFHVATNGGGEDVIGLLVDDGEAQWYYDVPVKCAEEPEKTKAPRLDFQGGIELLENRQIISKMISKAAYISDHVHFTIRKNGFQLHAKGDLGKVNVLIPAEKTALHYCHEDGATSMFSIEYLRDIFERGFTGTASKIRIDIGHNIPVLTSFQAGEISLKYMLAPRIEGE